MERLSAFLDEEKIMIAKRNLWALLLREKLATYGVSMENNYTVYILLCADGSYYTGMTNDVAHRVDEHQHGIHKKSYTFKRRPVELVYTGCFSDVNEAIHWEKIVKGWRREKKEALIRGEFEKIPELSRTAANWKVYPRTKRYRCALFLALHSKKQRRPLSSFAGSG